MIEPTKPKRLPLSTDTGPSDEELATVMREARDLAASRKLLPDEWMRVLLAEAVAAARARDGLVAR